MNKSSNRSVASIKARLLNVAKASDEEFQHTLERFAIERFLVRIAQSKHRNSFVLKGATLYTAWTGEPHRPTRDLDLLGHVTPDENVVAGVVREVCETRTEEDGLTFDAQTVSATRIREENRYGGIRVLLNALLGKARIRLQIDVGFGDTVTPNPIEVTLPSILEDIPSTSIMAYNIETVVAEKLEALVSLGATNSRMKDFYDLWTFANRFEFDGRALRRAVENTFNRRNTAIPTETPAGLTADFAQSPVAQRYWPGFVRSARLRDHEDSFSALISEIAVFVAPLLEAIRDGAPFTHHWPPGGPWSG